ncbi:PorP/SprF family type IX secretion system membrane protein [Psychroflexus aestuariivivens]|uniref:PorP/SprF family type IX secretion system membrane protein n=1 Tax=Psychroflexus aestuariivivens TaxID=1795040 RepID=UPI000FDC2F6E|nr:type IX secretion system membrane protein PorP/SprF [Psychroflexus aestuariivivens]
MSTKLKFNILIFSLVLLSFNSTKAQQDPNFTQYMYNTMIINPAYAGSRGVFSATALHRSQWMGFDGAPQTQTFSAHSPIRDGEMGLGLNFTHDQIGVTRDSKITGVYSYSFNVSRYTKLSFGLNAGVSMLSVDFNELNVFDPNDPNFQNQIENKISPEFGLGMLLHNDKYFIGLSVPSVLETNHFTEINSSETQARDRLHYYMMGGYVFDLSPTVLFKPSFLFRHVEGAPFLGEFSANFLFNEKFTLGAAYRLNAAFSGIVGFQVSDSILMGVAYDSDITEFTTYNDGTFEFFIRFELFKRYKKMYTPRFF